MIKPYDPRKHAVKLGEDPPMWKRALLVFGLAVVVPLLACVLVEAIIAVGILWVLLGVAIAVGGTLYGVANVERIRSLDDD